MHASPYRTNLDKPTEKSMIILAKEAVMIVTKEVSMVLDTRQKILQAASDLFMNLGFQATSTRMIAQQAGITQPNLYHYFANKEEIYLAVLEELGQEVSATLMELTTKNDWNLTKKLQEIVNVLQNKHPVNFFMMRHDISSQIAPESFSKLFQVFEQAYISPLVKLFEYEQPKGLMVEPQVLARHFYATLAPYIQKENQWRNSLAAEQIIELFIHGIYNQ